MVRFIRNIKIKNRLLKMKKGTTMIEVLVAFFVVMIVTASFTRVVSYSSKLLKASTEYTQALERTDAEYYKNLERSTRTDLSGAKLAITIDTEKTKKSNYSENQAVNIDLKKGKVCKWTHEDSTSGKSFVRYSIEKNE